MILMKMNFKTKNYLKMIGLKNIIKNKQILMVNKALLNKNKKAICMIIWMMRFHNQEFMLIFNIRNYKMFSNNHNQSIYKNKNKLSK